MEQETLWLRSPLCHYKHITKNSRARAIVTESFQTTSPLGGKGILGKSRR
jgi:hypothetical protein